jgi:hypothetical protein
MADLSITAADVKTTEGSAFRTVQFGETATAGETVYLKSSDQKFWLGDNGAADTADVEGIVLVGNATDEWGIVQTSGDIDVGATLTVGTVYVQSATAGGIAPEADIASTEYVTILGVAKTAALLALEINATGVQHA